MSMTRAVHYHKTAAASGDLEVVPENTGRLGLFIQGATETVRVTFNGTAPSSTYGWPIAAGGTLTFPYGASVPGGQVKAWSSGGTGILDIIELVPYT